MIFEKNHWAPSEVAEVKRSFSRSPRPNFGFHLVLTGFDLEFSSFWVSMSFDLSNLGDLRRGSVNFFKNYIFEISASSWEKWAIARLSSQTFTSTNFSNFLLLLGGLGGQRVKNWYRDSPVSAVFWSPANRTIGKTALIEHWFSSKIAIWDFCDFKVHFFSSFSVNIIFWKWKTDC